MEQLKNSSTVDIRKNNYKIIYNLFFHNDKLSKQEIASQLNLSLPTVTQNLAKLEKHNCIKKDGLFRPQGGRPAAIYTLCPNHSIAIGVEIAQKEVRISSVNLRGELIHLEKYQESYINADDYYQKISGYINDFIAKSILSSKVLGVGISLQGIASSSGDKIIYGKTSNCTGLTIDVFQQYISYPCKFFHDVKCAANREIWVRKDLTDAFYLSIGEHLGGTLIINRQIYLGLNGYSGTIEHITINPAGKKCYCGKRGCLETYCSLSALLKEDESLNDFFAKVRQDKTEYVQRWHYFLKVLSRIIGQVYLLLNQKFIIGGNIAPYLNASDIDYLYNLIKKSATFPIEENFIYISHIPENSVTVGAALPFIAEYLSSIDIQF